MTGQASMDPLSTEYPLSEKQFYFYLLIALSLSAAAIISIWISTASVFAYSDKNRVRLLILHGPYGSKLHFQKDHGAFSTRTKSSNHHLIWQGIHADIQLLDGNKSLATLKAQLEALRRDEKQLAYQISNGHLVFTLLLILAIGQWIGLYFKITRSRKRLR